MTITKIPEVIDYIEYCKNNPHKVSPEVHLLIKNVVLPLFEQENLVFNEKMYRDCINYCEKWYVKLFPFQRFLYYFIFIFDGDDPYFKMLFYYMGRGNGKDGFLSPLLNFLQTPMYNIEKYHIDIVANSELQAHDSYDVVYNMLEENEPSFEGKFKWNKEVITNLVTKSKLRFNTSNAKTKDGKKIGAIWFNEYHGYETMDQVKVFTSALGKVPHSRTFITSTDGNIRGGALDELLSVSSNVLNGENNTIRIFPYICRIHSEEEADDPENWSRANPSIDYLPVLKAQIEYDYKQMKVFPSLRVEFFTKRMNYPKRDEMITVASWLKIWRTNYIGDEKSKIVRELPNIENKPCVIGIDFSSIRDFVSVYLIFKVDGNIVTFGHTWICANSPFFENIKFPFQNMGQKEYDDFEIVYGHSIDALEVVKWVADRMREYPVRKIIMDNYRFQMVKQQFESYGISIESKTNPHGLVRMIRNFPNVMSMVAPKIEYYFAEEKIIAKESAIWRWFVNNTGMETDGDGNKSFFKVEPKLRKNDGFMAFAAGLSEESLLEEKVFYY